MNEGQVIAGRYELLGELGAGAAAIVYRAVDRETREEVALKLLRPRGLGDPESFLAAFHHEFRLLTRLAHPHLVRVHDFGLARLPDGSGEAPFYTMDLVHGRPADEVLGPAPDWRCLARVADAVADALGALHAEGLVHRDVTCGNVLVGEALDADPPPVWLMDLGLAGRIREESGETLRGTPATVAPETLRAGVVDGRADLYSLGCVLYRLATGQDPFVGRDPWEILRAHLSTPPVPPRELNPEIPPSLEELVLALLEKDPARRPPTAEAVRERLADLAGRAPGRGVPHRRPLAPSFAGREREMDVFREALAAVNRGRGEVLLLAGVPGSGRTRLLDEMRLAARLEGRPAFVVGALDVPPRPFGAVDALLAELARERDPAGEVESAGNGIERRVDRLAGLLAGGPSAVLVDDADRLDTPSREVLAGLAARARDGLVPVLLVLAFRRDEGGDDPLAERLLAGGPARRLELRPLAPGEASRVAASMLGRPELPPAWEAALAEETGGLPRRLVDLVGALVRAGRTGPGAPLPEDPRTALAGLREAAAPLAARIAQEWERLGPGARAILASLAVAGGEPVAVADLRRLEPRVGAEPEAVGRLVEAGLVRRLVAPGRPVRLAPASPALGPAILERIPEAERSILHRRMADLLAGDPAAAETRARHLEAAGEEDRARDLRIEAAERALALGIPREAARIAGEALDRLREGESPHREAALRRIRAQALAEAGAHGEAEPEFRRALAAAEASGDSLDRAACLGALGAFLGSRGRTDEALRHLEEALALLDEIGDTAGGGRVLLEIGRILVAAGRPAEAEERLGAALRQARRADRPDLEAEILLALGELAARAGRGDEAGEHYRAAETAAQRAGVSATRAAARRGKILALMATGRIPEAMAEAERWLEQARQAGSVAAEAEARALAGRLAARGGRRGEALAQLDRAIELRRRLGQAAEAALLMAEAAGLLLERGQPRAARVRAEEARSLARRAGSDAALREAERVLARIAATLGTPDATVRHLDAADPDPAERSLLLGRAALAAGQADRARQALQEACFLARRRRLPEIEDEGLALLAEAYLALREDERAQLALRKLRAAAREPGPEAAALGRLVAAERELALPDGDMVLARDEAERAAEVLVERERGDLAWRAFAALAAAARRLGDVDLARRAAGEAFRRLDALLVALPEGERARWERRPRVRAVLEARVEEGPRPAAPAAGAPPAGDLARRVSVLERLLEINRALNSTLELGPLLRTLLDTAIELTGAERGFLLLEQGGNASMEVARGEGGADLSGTDREMSRSVARQVMREERPLLAHDAQDDPRLAASRSVHALRIRSILATPLRVRGRVAGALVLDSRSVAGMFGPEDQEILVRLADQAGIALANARLVEELRRQAEEIRRLNERLRETIEEQKIEILEKQSNLEVRFRFDCMIGASPAMQRVYRSLEKILETEIPVLVTGESGTGKDLVARVLHYNGPRREKRFVTVNCAALTDTLLESELFGHRRGAFTGADRDRKGLFEQADGGTLFLDEIGEMPLHLQPKLLRAIQFGEIRRVGEDTPRHVDVRIVAATNRDLAEAVAEGSFREDLFYRLDVARIHLPPLRERMEDIGLLVEHFLEQAARKAGGSPRRIEPAALRLFLRHDWPGNVRELENEVLKLATFTEGDVITEVDVLENATFLEKKARRRAPAPAAGGDAAVPTLEEAEIEQIRQALRAAQGNRTKAARMLGIDRSTLYRKLKRLRDQLGEDL